ncbi:MAG: InlB B-repeat-containing protein, partial [Eubacterium sp.]|nr:InlB B-repeat-containing protein [Eubacterium sp.]
TSMERFIPPYVSKAAEGQNDGWKFMGWLLTGDKLEKTGEKETHVNADQLGKLILPAVHTIACNYSVDGATEETAAQHFNIYNGKVSLTDTINTTGNEVKGVTWTDNGEERAYANDHKGLTMIAQWRWRQAFIPQVVSGTNYTDSANGGTVEITSVTDISDTNYNAAYNANGGKSYHAETDETITAKATAKSGYTFEGWYDASGNLITTNTTYTYVETKESVNTYYARFSGSVTQIYIRQVKNGDTWEDTTEDTIGTLGRYEYIDAPGMPISSTATAGAGYKFVGWYDSTGNKVADTMLINDGATISYTTTGDATYYARFETTYTVKFVAQTKQANGSFKTDTVGGKVSVASVTDVDGAAASSKATANSNYKFLGWYDKDGNQLSTNATYSTTTTSATNNVTYYARFEIVYNPTVENKVYLSFIAESEGTQIPSAFDGRDAGTGKNAEGYGLENKYGNTISTGFKYSLNTMTDVSTIQITITVPASAYVKVGGTGSFTGNETSILTDSAGVAYNKGSIQQISSATTLTYYWDASGLQAGTTYGFIIDNLYAPGATATITVNGTAGTKVTNDNGVVNTASGEYRGKSHYPK